jgi:hypothetical protein
LLSNREHFAIKNIESLKEIEKTNTKEDHKFATADFNADNSRLAIVINGIIYIYKNDM